MKKAPTGFSLRFLDLKKRRPTGFCFLTITKTLTDLIMCLLNKTIGLVSLHPSQRMELACTVQGSGGEVVRVGGVKRLGGGLVTVEGSGMRV